MSTILFEFAGGSVVATEYVVVKQPSQVQVYSGIDAAAAASAAADLRAQGLRHAIVVRERVLFDGTDA